MPNFYSQFDNFTAFKGLYRVWVRTDDREGAPLVARWIDPRVAQGDSQAEDKNFQTCEEICLGEESGELEADSVLHLTFVGAF
jgi:hypothetical protein